MHLLYTPQKQLPFLSYCAHALCANIPFLLTRRLRPSCHSDYGGDRTVAGGFLIEQTDLLQTPEKCKSLMAAKFEDRVKTFTVSAARYLITYLLTFSSLGARLCAKKPSPTTGDFGRRVILIFGGLIETWLVGQASEQQRGISLLIY